MSERLRNFKQRGRITQLINGLLIGLEIKDRKGRRITAPSTSFAN